jgi:hypothetical protein
LSACNALNCCRAMYRPMACAMIRMRGSTGTAALTPLSFAGRRAGPLGRALAAALNDRRTLSCRADHQGKGNVLLFPRDVNIRREPQPVKCGSDWVGSCAITRHPIRRRAREKQPVGSKNWNGGRTCASQVIELATLALSCRRQTVALQDIADRLIADLIPPDWPVPQRSGHSPNDGSPRPGER